MHLKISILYIIRCQMFRYELVYSQLKRRFWFLLKESHKIIGDSYRCPFCIIISQNLFVINQSNNGSTSRATLTVFIFKKRWITCLLYQIFGTGVAVTLLWKWRWDFLRVRERVLLTCDSPKREHTCISSYVVFISCLHVRRNL